MPLQPLPAKSKPRPLLTPCVLILSTFAFILLLLAELSEPGQILTGEALAFQASPEPTRFIFLPSVLRKRLAGPIVPTPRPTATPQAAAGIQGRVTFQGTPAAGIPLKLYFYQGSQETIRANTTTGPDGRYSFANVPVLSGGQSYQVAFGPNTRDSRYVYSWDAPEIATYTGGAIPGGDFDIADVPLKSPPDGAEVGLPTTFTWQVRSATPSDNYYIHISGLDNPDLEAFLPPAGYTGSATMPRLPSGFSPASSYLWEVWVDGPGGFGISFGTREIVFTGRTTAIKE